MPRKNFKYKPTYRKVGFSTNCDKQSYDSKIIADKIADEQMLINRNLDLKSYYCDACQKWHLTKSSSTRY